MRAILTALVVSGARFEVVDLIDYKSARFACKVTASVSESVEVIIKVFYTHRCM